MIHQIDIIALHVVAMCEELISSLASEGCVNGIRNTAIKCLNTNKRKIGLKSFYLYAERKWSESFIACLNFENYDEDIKIRFKLSNSYKCIFTASVIGPTRVISKPIVQKHSQLDINKFVYCNPHHNILYIDNLVEEMTDGYEFFSLSDITNWRNDINNSKKEVLLTFADGIKDTLTNCGVDYEQVNYGTNDSAAMVEQLKKGTPMIVSVRGNGQQYANSSGHTIVLLGMTEDGKVIVGDSYSAFNGNTIYTKSVEEIFITPTPPL